MKRLAPFLIVALLLLGFVPRLLRDIQRARSSRTGPRVVTVVHPQHVKDYDLTLPGTLAAVESAVIYARATGYLRERNVDIGSRVRRGEVLAVLEAPDLHQSLLEARAQTARSRAATAQAEANRSRSQAGVSQAQANLIRARANLAAAREKRRASQTALANQEAALKRARASLELAQVTFKRYDELGKAGAAPDQVVDEQRAALREAEAARDSAEAGVAGALADLAAAKAAVDGAQADLVAAQEAVVAAQATLSSDTAAVEAAGFEQEATRAGEERQAALTGFVQVLAPFEGVITSRNIEVGALVQAGSGPQDPNQTAPGAGLFGIAKIDRLRVVVQVPEENAAQVGMGLEGTVQAGGASVKGKVWKRSGALDQSTRTLRTEVLLDNPKGLLLPGMFAQVHFRVQGVGWMLPSTAVRVDAEGTRIAVVEGDRVKLREVEIGRDLGAQILIRSDLKESDSIIADPAADLKDGTVVTIKP